MKKRETLINVLMSAKSCKTITEIAQQLYVSQPYITKLLREYENKYNVKLINREQTPIKLTTAGNTLLESLNAVINDENKLKENMRLLSQKELGTVSVTFNQPYATILSGKIFRMLDLKFPNVFFNFYEDTTDIAQQKLLNRETDIFVGSMLDNNYISSYKVTNVERPYFLIPKSNELYFKIDENTDLSENLSLFENHDFIGLNGQSYFQERVNNMFKEKGVNINFKANMPNTISASFVAINSSAIAITLPLIFSNLKLPFSQFKLVPVPESLFPAYLGISILKNTNKLTREIVETLVVAALNHYKK
ncbi:DNA-binding transcriptional LysR family regulator [Lactobacillus colini]|uniref:DNA-binding transcriptional LysR family regulator n=1 Tax=Lactobacillus colini TaxID=1819254 RepID=A0ABS4MEU2_9LACO|nr:LysR family transcriptional regulator [Lactobacillus colini]MBP2058208.1 DNA-binding transcriptional LysR family regulator [Lactobacillus colini]